MAEIQFREIQGIKEGDTFSSRIGMTNGGLTNRYILLLLCMLLSSLSSKANDDGIVNISGTSLDMKDNSISVKSINTFFNDRKINYLASQRNQTGEFSLAFKLARPQLCIFSAFFKNWFINIRPTDSVTFKIEGKDMDQRLEFFGKEASRYNFDVLISVEVDKAARITSTQDLYGYKKLLDDWKKNSEHLVNRYLAEHKVDKTTADAGKNRINYQYVKSIYYKAGRNGTEVVPSVYFDQADKYSFRNDIYLNIPEYQSAIYYKYIANVPANQEHSIKFVYQQVQSRLQGKTRDFALTFLAGEYARKGFINDNLMLRQLFDELYSKKLDSSYSIYLRDNEMRYFVVGRPLPVNVLDSTFLEDYTNGKALSISQVLHAYKGKAIYLDLWASWCAPCRSDIANSSEIKKFLLENDILVVYLSTDTDQAAWKKASEQDNITKDQYRFNNKKNYLTDFIGLEGIPRYLLLDKHHNVKTLYAPRPYSSDKIQFEKLVEEMKY